MGNLKQYFNELNVSTKNHVVYNEDELDTALNKDYNLGREVVKVSNKDLESMKSKIMMLDSLQQLDKKTCLVLMLEENINLDLCNKMMMRYVIQGRALGLTVIIYNKINMALPFDVQCNTWEVSTDKFKQIG